MNKYKFNDKDGAHEHLLWSERKEDWEQLTGATTIVDVLGKTLTWWASGMAVSKLGWINDKIRENGKLVGTLTLEQRITHLKPYWDKIKGLDDINYLSLLDEAYKAHSVRLDETVEAGTDLHAELEKYVKWHRSFNGMGEREAERVEMFAPKKWSDKVLKFAMWADKNVKRFLWSEGYCYDELLFVGGISDCGAELNDGSYAIIDFKSSKEAYFNHFVQIATYDQLIERNGILDKDGNQIDLPMDVRLEKFTKYIVIPFGAKEFAIAENTNIKGLKRAALACVTLYREKSALENQ